MDLEKVIWCGVVPVVLTAYAYTNSSGLSWEWVMPECIG